MHNKAFGNTVPEIQSYEKIEDCALKRFVLKPHIKAAET